MELPFSWVVFKKLEDLAIKCWLMVQGLKVGLVNKSNSAKFRMCDSVRGRGKKINMRELNLTYAKVNALAVKN